MSSSNDLIKRWVKTRIDEAESTRTHAMKTFEEQLDAVISEPLQAAATLIDAGNPHSASREELNAAGYHLFYSNNVILAILTAVSDIIQRHKDKAAQVCARSSLLSQMFLGNIPAPFISYGGLQLQHNNELEAPRPFYGSRQDVVEDENKSSATAEPEIIPVPVPAGITFTTGTSNKPNGSNHECDVPPLTLIEEKNSANDEVVSVNDSTLEADTMPKLLNVVTVAALPESHVVSTSSSTDAANNNDAGQPAATERRLTPLPPQRENSLSDSFILSDCEWQMDELVRVNGENTEPQSPTEDSHCKTPSIKSDISPIDSALDLAIARSNTLNQSSQLYRSSSHNEVDLDGFLGVVSDISSPSSFSIQRMFDLPILKELGSDLHQIYKDPKKVDDRLRIKIAPKKGDICAVKFIVDNSWYRGRVLQQTGRHTVLIEYIDYGNSDEILWQNAFKLPKMYRDIPRISFKCGLGGIRPLATEKGNVDGKTWSDRTLGWFDQTIYNITVKVIPIFKTHGRLSVQLFTKDESVTMASKGSGGCISDIMVELGYAEYDVTDDETGQVTNSSEGDPVPKNSNFQSIHPSKAQNAMSQSDLKQSDRTTKEIRTTKSCNEQAQSRMSEKLDRKRRLQSDKKPSFNTKAIQIKSASLPDDLSKWDPLAEDFYSVSNSYAVDNENACTMIEGYDPDKITVCKHFLKNGCWKGDNCPNLHPQPKENGEYKMKVPTFSGSDIPSFELREGNLCVARITKVDRAKNFYVHIIKVIENREEFFEKTGQAIMQRKISEDLNDLLFDMQLHCNGGSRRMRSLLQPAIGEVYIVYVEETKCFHRGMICGKHGDGHVHGIQQRIAVHLIDLGQDVTVSDVALYPMSKSFMHLPKQAVQCRVWEGNAQAYKYLAKMTKDGEFPNCIIRVVDVCSAADGPVGVSVYNVRSHRLEKVL